MSLFKKRAQKRAADAAAPGSAPLAKLSINTPIEMPAVDPAKVTRAPAEPAINVPAKSAAKFADEPPAKFSAALAARLSGEPQVAPAIKASISPTKSSQEMPWEIWYAKFKTVATLGNPRLQLQGADENIIDLMDHEPLKEAFNSAVDPTQLGEQFAADFDVGAFLRDNGVFK